MARFIENPLQERIKSWSRSDILERAKAEIDRLVQPSQELEPRRKK